MKELVFLLEERSAKGLLDALLPRVLNPSVYFRCIPFEGKQDLEKQLVRKIKAYRNSQAYFIILRDQDSHPDCMQVKKGLLDLCGKTGKQDRCLVRIACRELETFYLADLAAVEQALSLSGLVARQGKQKFRSQDRLEGPSAELKKLTGGRYQKISGSCDIGRYLDPHNDRSPSFRNLIEAIHRLESRLLQLAPGC